MKVGRVRGAGVVFVQWQQRQECAKDVGEVYNGKVLDRVVVDLMYNQVERPSVASWVFQNVQGWRPNRRSTVLTGEQERRVRLKKRSKVGTDAVIYWK